MGTSPLWSSGCAEFPRSIRIRPGLVVANVDQRKCSAHRNVQVYLKDIFGDVLCLLGLGASFSGSLSSDSGAGHVLVHDLGASKVGLQLSLQVGVLKEAWLLKSFHPSLQNIFGFSRFAEDPDCATITSI
ncbi:hypothetical protein DUNSADRAFT_10391 [Dunaliella salina]|uniref:Encoded protein n=1 Tax=Dunaliella salina TaxID=3046 RepID=A0ABQ7GFG8_DUNSA|nr:hypothetical protein DUNSADRAFT_10391 [Dunaliella salina]|eukprot:KAF5833350.1 hypothetical protein DUNSADRAFT_10391 [Dunaliella salina]